MNRPRLDRLTSSKDLNDGIRRYWKEAVALKYSPAVRMAGQLSGSQHVRVTKCDSGVTIIYEQEPSPGRKISKSYLHLLSSEQPGRELTRIATEDAASGVGDPSGEMIYRDLSRILLSAIGDAGQISESFIRYLALALRALGNVPVDRSFRGGLASWQECKAKLLLGGHLDEAIPMQEIAAACGISAAHFARAFKQSTGLPPHRWLMERRLDHAKSLMLHSDVPLIDIANACGFSGQSHFTRIFTKRFGISPGVWRRTIGKAVTPSGAVGWRHEFQGRQGIHPNEFVKAASFGHLPVHQA